MAVKTSAKTSTEPNLPGNRQNRRREISGILLLAGGLFAGMSLVSMQVGGDPLMGPGGGAIAAGLYTLVGLGAYLVIAAMLIAAVRCFRARPLVDGVREGAGALLLLGSVAVLLHLPFADSVVSHHGPGGLWGQWLGEVTASFIGAVGAALVATTMLVVGILLVTEISMREVAIVLAWAGRHAGRGLVAGAIASWRVARAAFPEKDDAGDVRRERHDSDRMEPEIAIVEPVRAAMIESDTDRDSDSGAIPVPLPREESDAVRVGAARTVRDEVDEERAAMAAIVAEVAAVERLAPAEVLDVGDEAAIAAAAAPPPDAPIIVEPATITRLRLAQETKDAQDAQDADEAEDGEAPASPGEKPSFIKLGEGAFKLPTADLLEYIPPPAHDMDKQALYEMAERLELAMSNYGVRGKVKEIHMGPVVTMYEFAPAPGTRTGKIANLEKDLAMALEAQAVRIVAPIPGKAVVGVEVPNPTREMVYLKEILQDACFTSSASKLQVALGKDIKGAPVSVNLSKMPHLLVAGTTGSGKSVAVNGMITSMLYNASPEEVRFIMVDPKMLEL
ncbi:MAG TPA: DNA translocase FtsK 4TM domain-containing protein, partial [Polyangia bacterium]